MAPCLVKEDHADLITNALAWSLQDCMESVGVTVGPVFSYGGRGKLHLQEKKQQEMLLLGNHNIDHKFAIIMKD